MKKAFIVLVIAGSLVACNNESESTTTNDSTVKTEETQLTTPSTVDSSTVQAPLDSTAVEPLVDTAKH
jgi:uncharacterized protein YcfL